MGNAGKGPQTDDNDEMIFKLNTMLDEVDGCPRSRLRRFLLQNIAKGRSKATNSVK